MKTCDARKRIHRLTFAIALASSSVLTTAPASAQAEDQAAARSLFDEGRRLLKERQYADACRKLDAASKLYSSPGILLNLADCFEKVGRSASAWTEFGEAATVAARARRVDQVKEAKRRQKALEPKLTRLSVRVMTEVPGLTVKRDGTELAPAVWGTAVPVDPGAHEIRAEAPGREPWTESVNLSTPGETTAIEVPALRPTPTAYKPPPPREPEPPLSGSPATPRSEPTTRSRSRSHVLDWVFVSGGAAVGIAGGVLMASGVDKTNTARNENSPNNHGQAIIDYNSAKTPYYLGLGGVIAGGACVAAGVLMLTMWPGTAQTTGLRAFPWVGLGASGTGIAGTW
jgi:hypothetical protein